MGYASLTGALIARKGQARPTNVGQMSSFSHALPDADMQETPRPVKEKTSVNPVRKKDRDQQLLLTPGSQRPKKARQADGQTIEQQVRDRFTPPYVSAAVKKVTVRLDKKLLDAVKIQATLADTTQQDIFRQALEKYITDLVS